VQYRVVVIRQAHEQVETMAASTSYRLDQSLKHGLAERAATEGITETALVSRMLEEGLKAASYPGIVYRGGPAGRRAGIAGGPDVWEVIVAVRHAAGRGDAKVADAARQMDLPERLVRLAVSFAAANRDEVEERIALNDAAAERARELAEQRDRLLAS
jgi:hypothetical protein